MTNTDLPTNGFVGSWMVLTWNEQAQQGRVHPDDKCKLPAGGGVTLECIGRDGDYVVVAVPAGVARVVPFGASALPRPPAFVVGALVQTKTEHGHTPRTAKVKSLGWHFKSKAHVYTLQGTTKQYPEDDLSPAD